MDKAITNSDTIAAIATPLGEGGIACVRISGKDALDIADRVFISKSKKKLSAQKGYTALFGHIYDRNELLDEAVALVFKAPKSYTGEDTAELSVHGGVYLIKRVLRAVVAAGARIALPGEFTKRAFENGKISLSQAESVMNIISAQNEQALHFAAQNKSGALSVKIKEITDSLLFLASQISVFSDFPEDETLCISEADFLTTLKKTEPQLDSLLKTYDCGKLVTGGINTVIAGSPNAGKSTLMNLLSKTNRSIVTPIAGTTRDIIEETVSVGDYTLRLADTAGIRSTDNEVEKIGVTAALERIKNADLCLAVFDISKPPTAQDKKLIETVKDMPVILVLNKNDLSAADMGFYEKTGLEFVKISAKTGSGESDLVKKIAEVLHLSDLDPNSAVLSNERQYSKVLCAKNSVCEAIKAITDGVTLDAAGILIDDALSALLELEGKKITTEVANEVFKNFCVGK